MKWPTAPLDTLKSPSRYSFVGGPFGSELTTRNYVAEGVPVIRGNNLSGPGKFHDDDYVYVGDKKAKALQSNSAAPGDLVFTQRGTLGQIGWIPSDAKFEKYVISQSQMKLTVDENKANPLFLYYFFKMPSTIQQIVSRVSSSGVPHINLSVLKAFEVPVPDKDIQDSVVEFVRQYDDLIENNRRRIALLEQAARLLYEEWFVRFRFPGHENVVLVDGLPKGWKSKTLSTKASAVMGQSPPSKFYNEDGIGLPFHQGVKDYGDRFPINRVYCTQVGRVAEPGDILFSVRAPVGRINISRDRIVIGRGLAALRARDGHQTMLFHQLRAHFYKEDMIGTGAIYAAVKKTDLFGVNLVSPPEPQVIEFEAKASALDKQVEILTAQNETLAKTRDLLLPRLMSGEVEV